MNADDRALIRAERDRLVRDSLVFRGPPAVHHCGRCGCHADKSTPGCRTCTARRNGRRKRAKHA